MENNKKGMGAPNAPKQKLFIDGNGTVWNEQGLVVEDDCAPGSLTDFLNRTSNGEDPAKVQKECALAAKLRQEKIALAGKTGRKVELQGINKKRACL